MKGARAPSSWAPPLPGRSLPGWVGDAFMAAVVLIFAAAEAVANPGQWTLVQRTTIMGVLVAAVLLRRIRPYAAVGLSGLLAASGPLLGYSLGNSAAAFIGYASVIWGMAPVLRLTPALCAWLLLDVLVSVGMTDPVGVLLWNTTILGAVVGVSRLIASRTRALRTLAESARELEASRDAAARAELELERARISRDVHDVVAHSLSVMVIQAAAADSVLEDDRQRARMAISAVLTTGRETLRDLRTLLLDVPADDGDGHRTPPRGLADVSALLDHLRGSGLTVDVTTAGEPRQLAAEADLAAFRVVQESLTNVVKHAASDHVRISYHFGSDALRIDVEDEEPGPARSAAPGVPSPRTGSGQAAGHGLRGMRERAELCGGSLEAGPTPHGFRVRAVLPWGVA